MEDGLLAEIQFRKKHFESMRAWANHPNCLLLRYEDILGNETRAIRKLCEFYQLSRIETEIACVLADRYSVKKKRAKGAHVRNPSAGQWRDVFTPRVISYFNDLYGDILDLYSYNK